MAKDPPGKREPSSASEAFSLLHTGLFYARRECMELMYRDARFAPLYRQLQLAWVELRVLHAELVAERKAMAAVRSLESRPDAEIEWRCTRVGEDAERNQGSYRELRAAARRK